MANEEGGAHRIDPRSMRLAALLRRRYGMEWKAEPTITFRADGSVRVTARPDRVVELSAEEADALT